MRPLLIAQYLTGPPAQANSGPLRHSSKDKKLLSPSGRTISMWLPPN